MANTFNHNDKVVITDGGNVGIGTTSPDAKLVVTGDSTGTAKIGGISITGNYTGISLNGTLSLSNYNLLSAPNDASLFINRPTGDAIRFRESNSEQVTIATGGNVGIGTTSPGAPLHVYKSDTYSAIISRADWNSGTPTKLALAKQYGVLGFISSDLVETTNDTSYIALNYKSGLTTYAEGLRVHNNGNVGIGTLAPVASLQIGNGTSNTSNRSSVAILSADGGNAVLNALSLVNSRAAGDGNGTAINFHNANNYSPTGRIVSVQDSGTNASLRFSVYNSTDNTLVERITLLSSGNVGIGTTSPNTKLRIQESGSNPPLAIQNTNAAGYSGAWIYNSAGTLVGHFGWGNGTTTALSDKMYFGTIAAKDVVFTTNDSEKVRITSAGNVGIGTTAPITKLTVGSYSGSRLPYINGTANTFDANGITVTSSNTANAAIGGGIDLTNNVHSVGSFSPLISFSALSQSGTYNNNYAAIYGILAGDSGDGNWNTGHIVFATATAYSPSEKVRITSAGNVGIGTTSPSVLLDVYNGSGWGGVDIDGASGGEVRLQKNGTTYGNLYASDSGSTAFVINAAQVNDLILQTNSSERLRITSAGNVGVGTTTANTLLSIDGLANNGLSIQGIGTTATRAFFGLDASGDGYMSLTNGSTFATNVQLSSDLGVANYFLGNVGIGTTAPGARLTIKGTTNGYGSGIRWDNVNTANNFEAIHGSSNTLYWGYNGTTFLQMVESSNLNFVGSGNVGIGTTSPSYKLDVNGSFNATSVNVTNDISTSAGNVVLANDAGIYSFSDTVNAGADEAIFRISNTNGAQAFRVSFVCNTSGYSVAKTYEVVHAYAGTPVAFKVVDTGPYSSNDFDVTFTDAATYTGIECSIRNNSLNVNANIVTTIFLAGSTTSTTITEL